MVGWSIEGLSQGVGGTLLTLDAVGLDVHGKDRVSHTEEERTRACSCTTDSVLFGGCACGKYGGGGECELAFRGTFVGPRKFSALLNLYHAPRTSFKKFLVLFSLVCVWIRR